MAVCCYEKLNQKKTKSTIQTNDDEGLEIAKESFGQISFILVFFF